MVFKEAVTQRILELCDQNNYTPNKLAEMSATPPSTLRALLANKVNNPSSYLIYRVCRISKISLKEFYDSPLFDYDNLDD